MEEAQRDPHPITEERVQMPHRTARAALIYLLPDVREFGAYDPDAEIQLLQDLRTAKELVDPVPTRAPFAHGEVMERRFQTTDALLKGDMETFRAILRGALEKARTLLAEAA